MKYSNGYKRRNVKPDGNINMTLTTFYQRTNHIDTHNNPN